MGTVLATFFGLLVVGAGLAFLVWLLWWLWKRREEGVAAAPRAMDAIELQPEAKDWEGDLATSAPDLEGEPPAVEVEMEEPDDLQRIEGIGPKIASVLQAAGIATFARLADTDTEQIEQILEQADPRLLRLADPSSWPEQARLAADGEWEALEALQAARKGGRQAQDGAARSPVDPERARCGHLSGRLAGPCGLRPAAQGQLQDSTCSRRVVTRLQAPLADQLPPLVKHLWVDAHQHNRVDNLVNHRNPNTHPRVQPADIPGSSQQDGEVKERPRDVSGNADNAVAVDCRRTAFHITRPVESSLLARHISACHTDSGSLRQM